MVYPKSIRVFAPGSVANVGPGFDCMGFALEGVGDELVFEAVDKLGIHLLCPNSRLSTTVEENVVGMAIKSLWEREPRDFGLQVKILKGIEPGSGIGSSAASAAAAAGGINAFLNLNLSPDELLNAALDGEFVASGARHADNVAPALFGGLQLIRSLDPIDIVAVPVPDQLWVAVIRPNIEIKTAQARVILPTEISLKTAIAQAADLATLVSAFYEGDMLRIARSMTDHLAEPFRKALIPNFDRVKQKAIAAGALAFGISGSGPSMFSFCKSETFAKDVSAAMEQEMLQRNEIESKVYVSKINSQGIKILK